MFVVPPPELELLPDQVHVWRAELQPDPTMLVNMAALLSVDEQARADRFYFAKDRDRFILGRGILRCILSRYLQVPAQQLRFSYSPTGKPTLSFPSTDLQFNLSHSGQLALYAVSQHPVGIDIEQINPDRPIMDIAQRFFSRTEQQELAALPPDLQPIGFFNGWTRKEAFLKAIGTGLSCPLDQFSVSLSPDGPAQLLETQWHPSEAIRWGMSALEVGESYAAAVVAAAGNWRLCGWRFVWEG